MSCHVYALSCDKHKHCSIALLEVKKTPQGIFNFIHTMLFYFIFISVVLFETFFFAFVRQQTAEKRGKALCVSLRSNKHVECTSVFFSSALFTSMFTKRVGKLWLH